ncbi:MAG: hypothetical protein DLM58_08445 [Pseudonocardiales bacterium]|nr:MAG: hypothetical protein DLM58_08445 [Pseudonocardiales bacterium]
MRVAELASRGVNLIRTAVLALVSTAAIFLTACSGGGSGSPVGQVGTVAHLGPGLPGVGTLPSPASEWPEAGYDARFSSGTTATGPQSAKVKWMRSLGGNVTPGPVIGVDGSILAATNAGVLHALDPATGAGRWTYDGQGSYGSDLSTSAAVLADGTILWPGPNNTLSALTKTGGLLWKQQLDGQVLSPAVAGVNRVYVADMSGHLSAFEITPSAHRLVWTLDIGGIDYSSASVGPDGTIYTGADHDLVAIRDLGESGAVRWRFDAKRIVEVSNGVAPDGTVVLGTNHGREYGVRPDGTVAWSFDIKDNTYSSSVVRPDGTAYFGDNSGRLRIVSPGGAVTHDIAPLGRKKESIWTSPAVDAKGNVYWGSTNGNVYGYDHNAKRLFALALDGSINSYPAIGRDGTLYLGTTTGTLYAIG